MADMMEGVLPDGTVTGHVVETHWLPVERLEGHGGRDGYVAIYMDGGAVDYVTRIRKEHLLRALLPEIRERVRAEVERSAGDWFFIDDLLARAFPEDGGASDG
jgi:hypothetical protein